MLQFALVIGNLVRGFHVITGFSTEEEVHNFVAENRRLVGSEYRVATAQDVSNAIPPTKPTELQDKLEYEPQKPGEVILPGGASLDTIDHNPVALAEESSDADDSSTYTADGTGATGIGSSFSTDDAALSGLSGTGGAVSGDGESQEGSDGSL